MARGTTPATTVEIALVIDENDSFNYQFEIEPTWPLYAIEFSQFRFASRRPGYGTNGGRNHRYRVELAARLQ